MIEQAHSSVSTRLSYQSTTQTKTTRLYVPTIRMLKHQFPRLLTLYTRPVKKQIAFLHVEGRADSPRAARTPYNPGRSSVRA